MKNNKHHNHLNSRQALNNQKGLSLIELLISMVVGLFLLAGVVTNFISTQTADLKRDAVSEMDANAAEALRVIRDAIAHAGYKSIENTRLEDDMAFFIDNTDVSNVACSGGHQRDKFEVEDSDRTRDGSTKDVLTVISLADNPLNADGTANPNALVFSDCTGGGATRDAHAVACSTDPDNGMPTPTDAKIYNSIFLIRNVNDPEDRTLQCIGNRGGSQDIVNNVETIQYLYGVKTDAGDITFKNADDVTDDDQWPMVASVQVGLLMRSSNPIVLDEPSTKTRYNVLDQEVVIANGDLQRLFRIYTTTINLENRKSREFL